MNNDISAANERRYLSGTLTVASYVALSNRFSFITRMDAEEEWLNLTTICPILKLNVAVAIYKRIIQNYSKPASN